MKDGRYYNEALDPDGLLTPEEQNQVNATANKTQATETPTDIVVGEDQQSADVGYARTRSYINDLIDASRARSEELQRKEKLSRAQEMVSGIADAGRAIGNLFYTTQYSPDAYADSGLSDKSRERAERYRAEREKNRDAIMNYYMMQDKLDDADKNWRYKLAIDKKADEQFKAKLQNEIDKEKRLNAQYELNRMKMEWQQQMADKTFNLKEAELELKRMVAEKKISQEQANYELKKAKLDLERQGTTTTTTKTKGVGTETTEKTSRPAGGSGNGRGGNGSSGVNWK